VINQLKLLAIFAFSVVLSACSGGSNSTLPLDDEPLVTASVLLELEASGAIPTLDRSSSLAGSDQNSNDIRDDIEQYILANYEGILRQSAANQAASAMQKALLVDISDNIAVKAAVRDIAAADNCIYNTFDTALGSKSPGQVSREIESMITNTKQRLLKYLEFNKALDGTSWGIPTGDTCV
jgi:hypothetical protein